MDEWNTLKRILEASIKRNGETALTNMHFLNIMKMVDRLCDENDERLDMIENDLD